MSIDDDFVIELKQYKSDILSDPELIEEFKEWSNKKEFLVLSKYDYSTGKSQFYGIPECRRGNSIYARRVRKRFSRLYDSSNVQLFNPKDRSKKFYDTSVLYITGTYDTKLSARKDAWLKHSCYFNKLLSYLRSKYGLCASCRVWESFVNGYPHFHAIIVFEKYTFQVHRDKKGKFRVSDSDRDIIRQGWHSNVDIQGCWSVNGGLRYLQNYLVKSVSVMACEIQPGDTPKVKADKYKALLTMALCHDFHKRAFACNGHFADLIRTLRNSKIQLDLHGFPFVDTRYKWYLVGFLECINRDFRFTELTRDEVLDSSIRSPIRNSIRSIRIPKPGSIPEKIGKWELD